jgi:hypothetical protein
MPTSRAPAAIDALIAVLTTAPALSTIPVIDGPILPASFTDCLFVGFDGDFYGARRSVHTEQEWAGLGAKRRTETINIPCAVIAIHNDEVAKPARDRAFALLATVETVLRTDPSLGQTPTPFIAAVTVPELWWDWTDGDGVQARLTFTVAIETRI